jgi:hypothetical protein
MQLEKYLISLDPHSFDRIDYLAHVKELQLKFGEYGKYFQKKDGQLIKLVLMNLRTPFDMFILNFYTNWQEWKEDGKDCTFEDLCGLSIIDQHILLDEGNIGGKHQSTCSTKREN